jgi:hypothetical protein
VVDVTRFPEHLFCPDVALKLRFSSCGSRRIMTRLNMVEHYEKMRRE